MSVDMTIDPWTRLIKLAPPGTNTEDLQTAANRYALTADVYGAAADLWEEAALLIDTTPDSGTVDAGDRLIQSVSQDGISVTYADEGLVANSMSSRIAQQAQFMAKSRYFRKRAKGNPTIDVHDPLYDPYSGRGVREYDPDVFITVNEVTEL